MAAPYFSELKYLGGASRDFLEVVVDAGTNVSTIQVVIYNQDGTIRTTNDLGSVTSTISGQDVYVIDTATSATFNGLHKFGAAALVVDGTVVSFKSFEATVTATEGPASGLTADVLGATGSGESFETTDGSNYAIQTMPNSGTVPCFVEGTMILTSQGYRAIETLQAGTQIVTRNNGAQALRWIGSRAIMAETDKDTGSRPIFVPADAIAPGIPERDLMVSPNHRILMKHAQCALLFGQTEILIPAKDLIGYNGIAQLGPSFGFSYFHLLFDQHEIITSNGLDTESFHPAHVGLEAFAQSTREEVLNLFPELRLGENIYGPTARLALRSYEANVLLGAAFGHAPQTQARIAA